MSGYEVVDSMNKESSETLPTVRIRTYSYVLVTYGVAHPGHLGLLKTLSVLSALSHFLEDG